MKNSEIKIDPYKILGVTYQATEEEIRLAWQTKMKLGGDTSDYIEAYALIRDSRSRNIMKWDEIFTCLAPLPLPLENAPKIDVADLISELAFLSPWELGEDICQN